MEEHQIMKDGRRMEIEDIIAYDLWRIREYFFETHTNEYEHDLLYASIFPTNNINE
jgi:hypothetical protein